MMRRGLRAIAQPATIVGLRLVGAAAAFALNVLLAHTMDTSEMGRAVSAMSVAMLLAIVASGSTEAGASRFVAAYLDSGSLHLARGYIRLTRIAVISLAPFLLVAGMLGLVIWSRWSGVPFPWALAIGIAVAAVMGWQRIAAGHAIALGHVIRAVAPATCFRQILFLGAVALWVGVVGTLSAPVVVSLLLVAAILTILVQHLWNRGIYTPLGQGEADLSEARDWLNVGLQLGLTLLFVEYSRDLTVSFASLVLAPKDVALLGVATALVGLAKFAVVAVNQSLTPKLASAVARNDRAAINALADAGNHMKFWPMFVAFATMVVFGRWLLGFFGPAFENAASILPILMIEPLALAFFGPSSNILALSGRQAALLPASIGVFILLALGVTLGGHFAGLTGAAWGVALAWLVWTGGLSAQVRRSHGLRITLIDALRRPSSPVEIP